MSFNFCAKIQLIQIESVITHKDKDFINLSKDQIIRTKQLGVLVHISYTDRITETRHKQPCFIILTDLAMMLLEC